MSGRDKLMLAAGSLIFVAGGPGVMALLTVWGGQVTFLPELTFTYGFSVFACAFGLFFAAWSVYEMLTKGEGGPAVLGPVKLMQETRHLVTTGPYALCRNPMHLGIILYFLGFACYLNSLWALAVPLAMTVFAFSLAVFVDEPRLKCDFPEEYAAWASRVPRFLPNVRRS